MSDWAHLFDRIPEIQSCPAALLVLLFTRLLQTFSTVGMDISKSRKGSRIDLESSSSVTTDDSLKILETFSEYKEHCDTRSLAVLFFYLTDTGICVDLKLWKYLKR